MLHQANPNVFTKADCMDSNGALIGTEVGESRSLSPLCCIGNMQTGGVPFKHTDIPKFTTLITEIANLASKGDTA